MDDKTLVEVTQADREAAIAYLKGKGPWKAGEIGLLPDDDYIVQAFATHRIEAAKAERDRLRELPDNVVKAAMVRANAVGQATMPDTAEEAFRIVATALADALESQP